MSLHQIDILLSTFNGLKFLGQQIDSVLEQSNRDWRLLIRDDGSTDGTMRLLQNYQERYPGKIQVIGGANVGATQSFHELLKLSDALYVMFCDQDDIWFSDKIEVMFQCVSEAERRLGVETPVLAFSDLALINDDGSSLEVGFWRYHGINPGHSSLNRLLLQNVVTGCACMFNRALAKASLPIPREAVLHDWWLALNAAVLGELIVIDRPTVYYRQHSANQVGARGVSYGRLQQMRRAGESVKERLAGILQRTSVQASALLKRHGDDIPPRQRELISGYASLSSMGAMRRKAFLLREGVLFSNNIRNLCLLFL